VPRQDTPKRISFDGLKCNPGIRKNVNEAPWFGPPEGGEN